jgi:hypothetical protein
MENPFLKRATEFLRDNEAFLAIVSPEPVKLFLSRPGKSGLLYDRLVFVRGTPGSGKTTLARLFEYPTLAALLRNRNIDAHKRLVATLISCKAIARDAPEILGCRLTMESDYRNFWEFPYPDKLKLSLMHALIQARAVLGWISNLTSSGIALENIKIIPRQTAEAATETIGGTEASGLLDRARAVELALYKIIGALIAPDISHLDKDSTAAYHPFDIIDRINVEVEGPEGGKILTLRPLVILDDAHVLHPKQFDSLQRWLVRRELVVARWILTRLDVMHPQEALAKITEDRTETFQLPGVTATRDTTEIMLQSSVEDRREQRVAFRKMAKDMANRYLRKMPLFVDRHLESLPDLLSTEAESLTASKQKDLEAQVDSVQSKLSITTARRSSLTQVIDGYQWGNKPIPPDLRLAMLNILMNRYAKRIPQHSLFEEVDPEPSRPLNADSAVYDAARIHLLHSSNRPYYIGIDDLCDASSENAEQFLHLAAGLVDTVATRLIRSKPPSLDAATQNKLLREMAEDAIKQWNFPQCQVVRHVVTRLAERCLVTTLMPNAPLGAGANAYGILQHEFGTIPEKYPYLARVLQFAIAYNAFTIVPSYECKKQEWCLLELGGIVILKHGLTLKRGGFLEGTAEELNGLAQETAQ